MVIAIKNFNVPQCVEPTIRTAFANTQLSCAQILTEQTVDTEEIVVVATVIMIVDTRCEKIRIKRTERCLFTNSRIAIDNRRIDRRGQNLGRSQYCYPQIPHQLGIRYAE